jgi:hypothetical protein
MMRSSRLLSLAGCVAALLVSTAAQETSECTDQAVIDAESTCKTTNSCDSCSDFNFGDDCDSNTVEHCAEIECCPACESEILAMFACEHGAACGDTLTCPETNAFEWAGTFAVPADSSTWSMRLSAQQYQS